MEPRRSANEGLKYAKLPAGLLYHPELRLAEKVFLGMVFSFNQNGLRLSNKHLGQILGLNESNISRMIARLEKAGWIRIDRKQSRWRRIYFAPGDKVNDVLLCFSDEFTLPLATTYFAAGSKQNLKRKKEFKKENSFFNPGEIHSLPQVENHFPTQGQSGAPQTEEDRRKLQRVWNDLGFTDLGIPLPPEETL
jgi:DNA-binding MarR family transcriptional regulator